LPDGTSLWDKENIGAHRGAPFATLSAQPYLQMKKPAVHCGPRADFFDDGLMQVICPTSQAFYRSLTIF
jgi:hypothetical protein